MDSLLASYATDEEDEEEEEEEKPDATTTGPLPRVSLFSRLPPPQISASSVASSGAQFVATIKSEEDGEAEKPRPGLFSKLPLPKGVGAMKVEDDVGNQNPRPRLFAKLPPPKVEQFDSTPKSSLFGALPAPKLETLTFGGSPNDDNGDWKPSLIAPPNVEFDSSGVKVEVFNNPSPKVRKQPVAFKPPIDLSVLEDDDDDWRPGQKKVKVESGSKISGGGGLSALLPAPKQSLGLGSSLGASITSGGRRAAMEIVAKPSIPDVIPVVNSRVSTVPATNEAHASQAEDNSAYAVDESSGFALQYSNEPYGWAPTQPAEEIPQNVARYHEPQNWQYSGNVSSYSTQVSHIPANSAPVADPVAQVLQSERRRGREDRMAAPNVIEVNQADLTGGAKLREDQIRTTGIAFGPSYQPVSSKDKPSKVHRRKHQIGTLLQDSKAREMDLLDRRAKGNLTKAETQAKYGW